MDEVVSNGSKILIWKQITTIFNIINPPKCCFQWFKDTNLKANHNVRRNCLLLRLVVSNGSKILIWKQITTKRDGWNQYISCFQWFKDTNLKANHNYYWLFLFYLLVVSNGSKILIWKQITTLEHNDGYRIRCFQWFKDTNLKANHNAKSNQVFRAIVVSNGSKILIWKQITTH